jgi:hypothetical protein
MRMPQQAYAVASEVQLLAVVIVMARQRTATTEASGGRCGSSPRRLRGHPLHEERIMDIDSIFFVIGGVWVGLMTIGWLGDLFCGTRGFEARRRAEPKPTY